MNTQKVGEQIAALRKGKGLTQSDLGERLGVTFQSVSKWERGETLPDTAILVDLADVLETTVDFILTGGERALQYRGKIAVGDMMDGLRCLENMGRLLGKENLIYRHAVRGINEGMNTDIEDAFTSEYVFECFAAEAVIQHLTAGAYVDPTDVKIHFRQEHFRKIVLDYCAKHGIK